MKPIDIARTFRQRVECPACKKDGLFVLESRKSGTTTRRRKECSYCRHRETTYELFQDEYFELKKTHTLFGKFKALIESATVENVMCSQCKHMDRLGCAFEFPEAGGNFAAECSMFEKK